MPSPLLLPYLLVSLALAADPAPLRLEDALSIARIQAPELRAADAHVDLAQAERALARRPPDPRAELAWLPDEGAEARLTLDLTDLARVPSQVGLADARLDLARITAQAAAARHAYAVRAAYYAAAAAEEALALGQQTLDIQGVVRDATRAIAAAGNTSGLTLARREAAYAQAELSLAALIQAREEAHARLDGLLGPGAPADWVAPPLPPVPAQEPLSPTEVTAASLDLAAARATLEAVDRGADLALRQARCPDLELSLLGTGQGAEARLGLGVEASLPVWGRGHAQGRAGQAQLGAATAALDAEAAAVATSARLATIRAAAAYAAATQLREVALPLQAAVSQETLLHYNAMQVDLYALLDARLAELAVARAEIEARRAGWTALAATEALRAGARVEIEASPSPVADSTTPLVGGH